MNQERNHSNVALQAGPGAVLGPTPVKDGWEVMRVLAVLPGRERQFREVRELVAHDWNAKEGERLMRALCDRARATAGVRLNERALAQLAEH